MEENLGEGLAELNWVRLELFGREQNLVVLLSQVQKLYIRNDILKVILSNCKTLAWETESLMEK